MSEVFKDKSSNEMINDLLALHAGWSEEDTPIAIHLIRHQAALIEKLKEIVKNAYGEGFRDCKVSTGAIGDMRHFWSKSKTKQTLAAIGADGKE